MQIEMKKIFTIIMASICITIYAEQTRYYITPLDSVNTDLNEFNPVISPKGNRMAYSVSKTNKHGDVQEWTLIAKGEWKSWKYNDKMLQLRKKNSHIDILSWPTEDTVYVYKGNNSGKIYIYTYTDNKWQKSSKIKLCSTRIKSACLNSTRTAIYFSTKKSKGVGGQDLYVCRLCDDGKWSKPISLGTEINTKKDEICPMLVGDSVLYFSSNGQSNCLGGYDIYYSKLDSGKWSAAINIGEPINSEKDDAFYYRNSSERDAYFSSNRNDGKGGMDIYAITYIIDKKVADEIPAPQSMLTDKLLSNITLQSEVKLDSTKITLVKGVIMGDDSLLLKAQVALSDNKIKQVIATQEAEENGVYKVILPGGSNYGIAVSYPGYLFHSENFDLPEQTEYKEINKDIILKKVAIGKNVALRNLFFETDKSSLSEESVIELGNVIKLLQDNPTMCIEIEGHTDNTGSKAHNQRLSEARAKSVVDYLINNGIAPERLTSKGYGFSKPIAPNNTPEGRAENRRTELLVTKI